MILCQQNQITMISSHQRVDALSGTWSRAHVLAACSAVQHLRAQIRHAVRAKKLYEHSLLNIITAKQGLIVSRMGHIRVSKYVSSLVLRF